MPWAPAISWVFVVASRDSHEPMGAGESLVLHSHARPPFAEPGSGEGCENGEDLCLRRAVQDLFGVSSYFVGTGLRSVALDGRSVWPHQELGEVPLDG